MGSLEASCILTLGRPDPQNGVGQKAKIFDLAQNDFGGVSDNFPEKSFLSVTFFSEGQHFLKFFSSKYASDTDF